MLFGKKFINEEPMTLLLTHYLTILCLTPHSPRVFLQILWAFINACKPGWKEGRRGLGPRNDVLTTCKAVTLRGGQRICAVYFSQSKYFRGKKRISRGSNSLIEKNNIMNRVASCENIVLISFKRMYGKWLPPARTQASPSELLKSPSSSSLFFKSIIISCPYRISSWELEEK